MEGVNKDLADVFGNLVNRCIRFAASRFGGRVPAGGTNDDAEARLCADLDLHLARLRAEHLAVHIRKAASEVRAIWTLANAYLTEQAPWRLFEEDPLRAAAVSRTGLNLVRTSAIAAWPFIPSAAEEVLRALAESAQVPAFPIDAAEALTAIGPGRQINVPPVLFDKITEDHASKLLSTYAGAGE